MIENSLDKELETLLHSLRQRVALLNQIEALVKEYGSNAPLPPHIPVAKRRGRKSMGAEERLAVSARMKKFWASQRKPKKT